MISGHLESRQRSSKCARRAVRRVRYFRAAQSLPQHVPKIMLKDRVRVITIRSFPTYLDTHV
jgi:hypothetical protein